MQPIINQEEYYKLATSIYELIMAELANPIDIEMQYPKFVIMYEFFRLLRGEAFNELREPGGKYQDSLYKMENTILKKLSEIKSLIPENSQKASYHMDNIISLGLKLIK